MKKIFNIILLTFSIFCFGQRQYEKFGFVKGEVYNPCKVTQNTFGAIKNQYGQWVLPIGHPMLDLIKEGYMIHPKKPNCMIPNPYSNAGRKLIASLKPRYAPSRGFSSHPSKVALQHQEQGIASDYLKNKKQNAKK